MDFDDATLKYHEIFSPKSLVAYAEVKSENKKFVYYTSADTAIKIIKNGELWLRNAVAMNDFSEISYGLGLIQKVFSGPEGDKFREAIESIYPGTIEEAGKVSSTWIEDWKYETYIACVSMHHSTEDKRGRLSMWRAYGNTALVLNNTPMMAITNLLSVFSVPVLYLSEEDLTQYLSEITESIMSNYSYLQGLGQKNLVACLHSMLFQFAISTKHPGFAEEKEWRIFYRPKERKSPAVSEDVVIIDGVPQKIYKLRLANEPENGLFGADIPSLLNKLIIGPTSYPYLAYSAFVQTLEDVKVSDPKSKVIVSDIPLRTN